MSSYYKVLVVHNVAKKNNVIALINASKACGFTPLIVGAPHLVENNLLSQETMFGCVFCSGLVEALAWLRERRLPLVGVEIMSDAKSLLDEPFAGLMDGGGVAFMPGNEGTGLSEVQKGACTGFVYIPQYGSGTASLNVCVASTIVMHHFNAKINTAL